MRIAFTIVLLVSFTITVFAQNPEKIDTDRPDQTESASIVPKGWFQAESGFSIETYKDGSKQYIHPTLLSKYGLSKRLELRLITDVVTQQMIGPADEPISVTGLEPIRIGGKLALWEEKGARPKVSLIAHLTIPKAASQEFQVQKWVPDARFTLQHTLSDVVSLGYNIGVELDGDSGQPTYIYTFAPGFNLAKNWYGYVEVFGFLNNDNHPQHNFDGGLAYYISNNVKIDISGGFGLSPNTLLKHYFALGFSFRTH